MSLKCRESVAPITKLGAVNTSGKTSTTKLRKYRLAESLITVFLT